MPRLATGDTVLIGVCYVDREPSIRFVKTMLIIRNLSAVSNIETRLQKWATVVKIMVLEKV
jgi:hypothetical protein